ncbi:hypothetical protein ACFYPK_27590 [Streptomyces halstedii]|uniref:hypothetical protein n=1 Tax=Streptomyces TaxID=1883 RepID=UPI0012FEEF75|nr:hypothetical protein [Streptomyces sp. NTK 937]WSX39376.1 hypothetical protein OG291_28850 [Streptomyces halstedii]
MLTLEYRESIELFGRRIGLSLPHRFSESPPRDSPGRDPAYPLNETRMKHG